MHELLWANILNMRGFSAQENKPQKIETQQTSQKSARKTCEGVYSWQVICKKKIPIRHKNFCIKIKNLMKILVLQLEDHEYEELKEIFIKLIERLKEMENESE